MPYRDLEKRKRYLQTWVTKNKGKVKQSRLGYMQKLRDQVYEHYGRRCNCCGETTQVFLSVDHILNDGAIDRKNGIVSTMLNLKIIKAGFPNTYQILCMNCNFGKMRNKGVCPHVSQNILRDGNDRPNGFRTLGRSSQNTTYL